ncbi:hypothetical protein [Ponticaulis sp.]|uniref:hypothetical protein n=1 Tax=Ponticaulis sp. TaxID=2020902 RepID=UPI0025E3A007|nr:hypothetical protein [Ponticaulis sp.]MDF1682003.1 hypothetical protein [Ponticaulis sp.]|tara:strand:- start:1637 stop:1789 length:153 start_codon:yes stop_codon:yes gene_type:complete
MLLVIVLPALIIGWFFYQMGRRERWKEKQRKLNGRLDDPNTIEHQPRKKK